MVTDPGSFKNPHSLGNRAGRLLWHAAWLLLFRPTPWFMTGWRHMLLRLFGARLGKGGFHSSVRIWAPWRLVCGHDVYIDRDVYLYNAFGMEIGDRVVISFGSVFCTATHDFRQHDFPLTGKQITIEGDVWIAAQAFIAPGVTIHRGAVVGARALVNRDVDPWTIVAGNPASMIGTRKVGEQQATITPVRTNKTAAAL